MTKLFISHSPDDDDFVRALRAALANHGQDGWIDSRELRGGDPVWQEIQNAIEGASAFAIVVSPNALQSTWVGKELRHALAVREQRGKDEFPVVPLSLDGTTLGMAEDFFSEPPLYIPVSSGAGGIEAAINPLLVALRMRLATDVSATVQPQADPLEELVLELSDLKFHQHEGMRRASARARLIYEPATQGKPEVQSKQDWRLIAPIGPIEAVELRWYLEKYAIWPSQYFRDRAQKVEKNLVEWGKRLFETAMPAAHTANVMNAWAKIDDHAGRRFSVYVETELEAGASEADVNSAKETATLLLALPWELLHDGENYLFQGAKPVRVRRRLPNTKVLDVPVVATPIRILLVTARPEDESCKYIDHRASALPLVEAMESLPGLVKLHILSPPTLPALRDELDRARKEKKPYHVVHFDGHGIFNQQVGLGGLCFEKVEDVEKLEKRGHVTVFTDELGPMLHAHRVPLVFLEACQTAQAEKASESVASELLKVGVASVVAMSHSVLVETSRRFVEAFYEALADGERVGDAMLAGQRELKDDSFRGRIFGAGELRLEDWFVPVLYQEKDDPQLFKVTPTKQTQEDFQAALAKRLGDLPPKPVTGFIGRSRELLALQRLLREDRYAVVRGQGGEGKTALASEFARWMVRSQQMHRAAFVSVEIYSNQIAIVDALGKQLVPKPTLAAANLEVAIQEIERALREQPALLVIDNMESVLLAPFIKEETPEALSADAAEELKAILALCERLLKVGDTRLIFTSREELPAPFDEARNLRELFQLAREDAVKLVERVLNVAGDNAGSSSEAAREEIEKLVDAVHCHARTLALLAPSLREKGVETTRESLVQLMEDMEKKFPGSREKSVFASVELSLRRMSVQNQDRARVLAVFQGGADVEVLRLMTDWDAEDVASLALDLVRTGLATPNPYGHLTLNPALCPYLRGLKDDEREARMERWIETMFSFVLFLRGQQNENAEMVSTLMPLELPNFVALLDIVHRKGDPEVTLTLATAMFELLQFAGKPRILERVGQVRDAVTKDLGSAWSHAQFSAAFTRIDQQVVSGHLRGALLGAQQLLQQARAAEKAYSLAEYDLAMACWLFARVLSAVGKAEEALPLLAEAHERFEAFAQSRSGSKKERMVTLVFEELGKALRYLGRFDESAAAYEQCIAYAEEFNDAREIAVGKGELGTVRMMQHRYEEAVKAHSEAREQFTLLNEPGMVAVSWHQTGAVYERAGDAEAAEDAYRKSLSIKVQLKDIAGQAATLTQLGILYDRLGRLEEAAAFYKQAVNKSIEIGNTSKEGLIRSNLADTLRKLKRFDEARDEATQAIECKSQFGHAAMVWGSWSLLSIIEYEAGNLAASAEARQKAIAYYLEYRRDGGENQDPEGRVCHAVTEFLLSGDNDGALLLIKELLAEPDIPSYANSFLLALQAIATGSRDRTPAEDPEFSYGMAAEILFLIETLEKREQAQA